MGFLATWLIRLFFLTFLTSLVGCSGVLKVGGLQWTVESIPPELFGWKLTVSEWESSSYADPWKAIDHVVGLFPSK